MLRKATVYVEVMLRKVFLIFKPSMGASHALAARTEVPRTSGPEAAGRQVGELLLLPCESSRSWRGGGPATEDMSLSPLSLNNFVVLVCGVFHLLNTLSHL